MAKLSPIGNNAQFINGIPANGAKLFFYVAGSSTKQTTYADEAGLIPQTNPIILDSRGEPAQPIWLTEGLSYKVVFTSSTDSDPPASPIWDVDNVTGVNDSATTADQWIDSGVTPTYVSATQFTLPGDQTSAFTVGRRIKALVTAGTAYGTIAASIFGALTTVTVTMDSLPLDSGLSSVQLGLITPTNSSLPYNLSASSIQTQSFTAFTTGGTSTAFTATPFPALSTYTNARLSLTLNATPGASPTMNWSGLGAKNWKYYDNSGNKQFVSSAQAINGMVTENRYDGTDVILMNPLPSVNKIQSINATVAANALTLTLNPTVLDFRSTTAGSGAVTTVANPAPITLVISSGSTLGSVNAIATRLAILAINNAGTMELAAVNLAGGVQLDEVNIINTTAEGGAGGADSATVVYSTTARASVAYRVVGFVDYTQATAGTYATAPSVIQGIGGQALAALSSIGYGQTWQNLTGSRAINTTYYNTTGKPIMVSTSVVAAAAANYVAISTNGVSITSGQAYLAGTRVHISAIIPPGNAYTLVNIAGSNTVDVWSELR
jgi:hypothetical protein